MVNKVMRARRTHFIDGEIVDGHPVNVFFRELFYATNLIKEAAAAAGITERVDSLLDLGDFANQKAQTTHRVCTFLRQARVTSLVCPKIERGRLVFRRIIEGASEAEVREDMAKHLGGGDVWIEP